MSNKPNKLIFLDMDHVLTNTDLDNSSFRSYDPSKYHLSEINLKFLDMILDKTGAKIVIASNWRKFTPPNTKWLYNGKYYESILEPFKKLYSKYIYDMLPPVRHVTKCVALQMWIDANRNWFDPYFGNYVILEDDLREEYQYHGLFFNRLILTDYHTGLTQADAEKAIAILNKHDKANAK